MARYSKQKVSEKTEEEAIKLAKGIQKPGQTKEQTKLIAQGIQKGIDLYKKQQKAKSRELDKKIKKVSSQLDQETETAVEEKIIKQQHWLPWSLLVLSWIAFVVMYFTLHK